MPSDSPVAAHNRDRVAISNTLTIPVAEIRFLFSRSSGPGGQNVNRRQTQVDLLFDVGNSPSLTARQRTLLLKRLRARIDSEGILHVVARSRRSQLLNRQEALARFAQLLRRGLSQQRPRIRTQPPLSSGERRLASKKRHGQRKRLRRRVIPTAEL